MVKGRFLEDVDTPSIKGRRCQVAQVSEEIAADLTSHGYAEVVSEWQPGDPDRRKPEVIRAHDQKAPVAADASDTSHKAHKGEAPHHAPKHKG
jgi:hypothetical protein